MAVGPESFDQTPHVSPSIQGHSDPSDGGTSPSIPGPSGGMSHFRQNLSQTFSSYNLDLEDFNFISNHLSKGSASSYGYSWKKFSDFCCTCSVDPFTCPPEIILKYLHQMFKKGLKYRTLNNIRSSISKFHMGYSGIPAGQHPLIVQAIKAAFRLRPPLPRYKDTYDIKPVLVFSKQIFGNNSLLSLKNLSNKCVCLLAFSSLSRLSTLRALGAGVEFKENYCIIPIRSLEKQSRGK